MTYCVSEFFNNDRKIYLVTNDDFMLLAVKTAGPPQAVIDQPISYKRTCNALFCMEENEEMHP